MFYNYTIQFVCRALIEQSNGTLHGRESWAFHTAGLFPAQALLIAIYVKKKTHQSTAYRGLLIEGFKTKILDTVNNKVNSRD